MGVRRSSEAIYALTQTSYTSVFSCSTEDLFCYSTFSLGYIAPLVSGVAAQILSFYDSDGDLKL